ncbi:LLM class flavin-dependent oxidoreductase, partial [Streptomyces chartreusis]
RDAKAGAFVHTGQHFDIHGQFNVPRSPQGRPVVFQAGDSEEGREFAASSADAIFSRYATLNDGQAFYTDVKRRLAKYGRRPDQLLILPAAAFALADTDAEAEELAREVRRQQVSGATALKHLEFVWNRDLSAYDPEGPLPDIDPDVGDDHISQGRAQVRMYRDPIATAREWRELAAANKWSIRDLVINTGNRQNFVGSPATLATTI